MGKGEIARYEQFLLFPQCFQKACFPGASKGVIVWEWVNGLMPFSTVFQFHRGGQCTCPCFPRVLLTSTTLNIFPSHWLPSQIPIVETTDSGERGINLVAMTVINSRKEYWPSRGSSLLFSSPQRYRLSYGARRKC